MKNSAKNNLKKPVVKKAAAPAKPAAKKPVAPAKKPVAPAKPVAKKPAAPAKKPVAKKPVAPAKPVVKKAVAPAKPVAKKPAAPAKKPVAPAKPVAKKSAAPAKKPVAKKPVAPAKPVAKKPETTVAPVVASRGGRIPSPPVEKATKVVPDKKPVKVSDAPQKAPQAAGGKAVKSQAAPSTAAASKSASGSASPKRGAGRPSIVRQPVKPVVEQEYSDDMSYSRSHVWVYVESNKEDKHYAKIGITDYLVEELGNIENIDLPLEDDELEIDVPVILLHTGQRKKQVRCPLTGRVLEVNQEVLDDPTLLFKDYRANWLFRMEFDDPDELDLLMSGLQYARYLDEL